MGRCNSRCSMIVFCREVKTCSSLGCSHRGLHHEGPACRKPCPHHMRATCKPYRRPKKRVVVKKRGRYLRVDNEGTL